jgi:hypothetical protein
VAETASLSFVGPALELSGSGSVDLLRQRLDAGLTVLSPPPRIEVSLEGPWVSPAIDTGKSDAGKLTAGGRAPVGPAEKEPAPQ